MSRLPARRRCATTGRGPAAPAIDLRLDGHVHTRLCRHATGSMEDYVRAAMAKGLRTIVFLEHLEAGISYGERTWLTEEDFAVYFEEGLRLRSIYADRLAILLGVEVGYNPLAVDILQDRLARHPWDRVGLSYHFFFDGRRHLNMVSRKRHNIDALAAIGPDTVVEHYFSQLISALDCFDNVTVLCHLDAVMRHSPSLRFNDSHWEQVERLLDIVRRKNISLEINTSGYALRNEPYPGRRIIRRAVELGIPLTAGSDAHHPEQVGRCFELLPAYLSDLRRADRPPSAE
ncbi:MAG: histidinol-phosphatase [Desulfobulbaceae bacterium]|nr:histidinol-phosphatase [Desulfobulbaceae bacterium]MDY0349674.1 histidinol-phosphatase [Desulfobulbaceae bacterium]